MKSQVSIVIRVRNANGSRSHYTAVMNGNGRLKPLVGSVKGEPTHLPKGTYYLRYRQPDGKRVWEAVGVDPAAALTAKLRRQHELDGTRLGLEAPLNFPIRLTHRAAVPVPSPASPSLRDTITRYIPTVTERLSDSGQKGVTRKVQKSTQAHHNRLLEFADTCSKHFVCDIVRADVDAYIASLKKNSKSVKTIYDRMSVLRAFLTWAEHTPHIVTQSLKAAKLKIVVKAQKVYNTAELLALEKNSPPEEQLIWEMFWKTGLRDQELAYLAWTDIDFTEGIIQLHEKTDVGFTIKDREERSVPIEEELLQKLRERFAVRRGGRWVLPTANDAPDLHFIRRLKRRAWLAGLNCGRCINVAGKSCATHPVCRNWQIHAFRRTAATLWSRSGFDLATIQDWLGHSDLETTRLYISGEDAKSKKTRERLSAGYRHLLGRAA